MTKLKIALIAQLQATINLKIEGSKATYNNAKTSRDNDTKSSAGDKFETGRAMMQMEMDKAEQQVALAQRLGVELGKIDPNWSFEKVDRGALVKTSAGVYFISIGLGKVKTEIGDVYAISLASPIGQLLYGRTIGESAEFNGRKILIESID